MRWLKWMLVAGWLGVHALLWAELPPVPRWIFVSTTKGFFAFTPNCRSLVTTDGSEVTVWDLADGRGANIWPPPGETGNPTDLVVAPVGRRAVIYDTYREAPFVIELDTGHSTPLPALGGPLRALPGRLGLFLGVSADGQKCVQIARLPGSKTPAVCVTDLDTGAARFIRANGPAPRVRCAAGGTVGLIAVDDGTIYSNWSVQAFDLVDCRPRSSWRILNAANIDCSFSADDRVVIINVFRGSQSRELQLWDVSTGRQVAVIAGSAAAGWTADGRVMALGDRVRFLDADGTETAGRFQLASDIRGGWVAHGGRYLLHLADYHNPPAWQTRFHQLLQLAPPQVTTTVFIRDTESGELRGSFGVSMHYIMDLSADGRWFARMDRDGRIRVWEMPLGRHGGIVLGLMIVEVGTAIAWTVWRRRRGRHLISH